MIPQRHHSLPPKVETSLNANSFTLLLVDDLAANRLLLKRLLERVGYRTVEAADGREALDRYAGKGSRVDLAILDVEMPEIDGVELTRRIRGDDPDFPLIVASGNPTDQMRKDAIGAGADLFLTKPFDFSALLKAISSLLKNRGPRQRRVVDRSAAAASIAGDIRRSAAPNEVTIESSDRLPS